MSSKRRRKSEETIRVTKLPYIPQNIMEEILHKLPYNAMTIFKLVCKSWNSIISSPNFINDHYNRLRVQDNTHLIFLEYDRGFRRTCNLRISYQSGMIDSRSSSNNNNENDLDVIPTSWKPCEYRPRLIGSYNGLVAISFEDKLILWNPLTNERSLVNLKVYYDDNECHLYGLCYDNFKDEYSVVVLSDHQSPLQPLSLSWFNHKDVPDYISTTTIYLYNFKDSEMERHYQYSFPRRLLYRRLLKGEVGKVICGVPHWVLKFFDWEDSSEKTKILYFDLHEKLFKEMGRPSRCVGKKMLGLATMNGECELGCVIDDVDSSCFEIWVMKEYKNVESWTNLYTFSYMKLTDDFGCMRYLDVMGFMPINGELLIYLNDRVVLVYDVYKGNFRKIKVEDGVSYELVSFEPKLISPPRPKEKNNSRSRSRSRMRMRMRMRMRIIHTNDVAYG